MGWRRPSHRRAVSLGFAILLVISTVGVYVFVTHPFREEPGRSQPTPDLGALPSRAWTLDVRKLTRNVSDVLLSLPQTVDSYYGYGSVLEAPTSLVGAIGRVVTTDLSEGQPISAVTLVGIDAGDGSAKWKRPIDHVTQCSDQLDSGVITCWNSKHVVFVDTETGDLLSDTTPDFEVGRSEVVDGKAFVSGIQHDGDKLSIVLTGGTPTTPASAFRRTIDVAGPISSVDQVIPSQDLFVISTQTGGAPTYQYTIYDLGSGTPRFTIAADILNVTGDGLFVITRGAESGAAGTQELVASDGSPILTAPVPAYTRTAPPTATSVGPPVFIGDGAYDPTSGQELWRDPRLLTREEDPISTIRALAGRTTVVASAETQTLVGLDLWTGQQVWQTPWTDAYWIYDGLTDGKHYVFSDYTGFHSLRVADGTIVWSIPLPPGAAPGGMTVSSARGYILLTIGSDISLWRQPSQG